MPRFLQKHDLEFLFEFSRLEFCFFKRALSVKRCVNSSVFLCVYDGEKR